MNASEQYYISLNQKFDSLNRSKPDIEFNKIKFSKNFKFTIISFVDIILLCFKLVFSPSRKSHEIIYTSKSFCSEVRGELRDRISSNILIQNRIYINHGKDDILKSIDGNKVYNVGIAVKFLAILFRRKNKSLAYLKAYSIVNNFILFFFKGKKVFSLCHYDLNGLSLVFSEFRENIVLIEIQHGSMINYYPYISPSETKIADVFYVKNQQTIDYLKLHLNRNFQDIEYKFLSYPESKAVYKKGKHILYASTVELNGIHPVFLAYLKQIKEDEQVEILIRLHPREKNKITVFENQVKGVKAKITLDESKNWLESNTIKNLIVVSPWSSVIEDAADNQYKSIIINEMGRDRFAHLIDNKNVIYANNLHSLLEAIDYDL